VFHWVARLALSDVVVFQWLKSFDYFFWRAIVFRRFSGNGYFTRAALVIRILPYFIGLPDWLSARRGCIQMFKCVPLLMLKLNFHRLKV
jgi:hypothetical protein